MQIHEERITITTNGGTGSENTSKFRGGVMRQFWVKAGTSNAIFRCDLTDDKSRVRRSYDFHRDSIDDFKNLPVKGRYTVQITDADRDGDFYIVMGIQE